MNSTYWPAWNWKFWVAGNWSFMMITSALGRSRLKTRLGNFMIGNSPAPGTVLASSTQSVCGLAQQVRTMPAASSSALSALL